MLKAGLPREWQVANTVFISCFICVFSPCKFKLSTEMRLFRQSNFLKSMWLLGHFTQRGPWGGKSLKEWRKRKKWKNPQKALTRAPCGVVTQRTSCLWGHRMKPPPLLSSQPIRGVGMRHQPMREERVWLDQEVGRAVRDPVARCSCWFLHRIYTAYWATDSSHRDTRRDAREDSHLRRKNK